MARNVRHRRERGQVRLTDWGFFTPAITTVSSGAVVLGSLNAAALALRPFTIIRQYYELYMISDQVINFEDQIAGFGTCVVSDQASAIGVTAVPTPITDLGSDLWMCHQLLMGRELSLIDTQFPGAHYSVDSKAMRKVNGDEDFVISVEASSAGSGLKLFAGGRFLIKLH